MGNIILLVDFGSTFTKVTAVDQTAERIVGRTSAVSTVGDNVAIGLRNALVEMAQQMGVTEEFLLKQEFLACSSAAGGLRMVTLGLIPDLTAEAGKRAALGAGAKVLRTYSFQLPNDEIREIERINPDIILLAGGTDGGNIDVITKNAASLARTKITCPVIVAGNKSARDEIGKIFKSAQIEHYFVRNVMPEIGRLDVEEARNIIREVFMTRIVNDKGMKNVRSIINQVVMPTPMAVLEAALLIAKGSGLDNGMGDIVVVDIGGATTDVHSIGEGLPSEGLTALKGLPEPYAKRTVEGDLGLRYNASTILEVAGREMICSLLAKKDHVILDEMICRFTSNIGFICNSIEEIEIETALAVAAVNIACKRHAGNVKIVHGISGEYHLQYGKDLRTCKVIIGTGGIFAYGNNPTKVLREALYSPNDPLSLRPVSPKLFIDSKYILYAVGLLAQKYPNLALKIARDNLQESAL